MRNVKIPIFLTHPFEVAVSVMFMVAGVKMALLRLATNIDHGFLSLPTPLILVWSGLIFLGGVLTLVGLWRNYRRRCRGVERAGLILAGTMFACLALVFAVLDSWAAWDQVIQTTVLSVGCFFRSRAVVKVDRTLVNATKKG